MFIKRNLTITISIVLVFVLLILASSYIGDGHWSADPYTYTTPAKEEVEEFLGYQFQDEIVNLQLQKETSRADDEYYIKFSASPDLVSTFLKDLGIMHSLDKEGAQYINSTKAAWWDIEKYIHESEGAHFTNLETGVSYDVAIRKISDSESTVYLVVY